MTDDAVTTEGRMVKAARVLRGWTQSDLANAARCARSTVVRIETGRPVRGTTRLAIAAVLGVRLPEASDGQDGEGTTAA